MCVCFFVTGVSHGECIGEGLCQCTSDWVGEACQIACLNGTNIGGVCVCDKPCIHGSGCQLECSGNGGCDVNGHCECEFFKGYKGDHCEIPSCPGWPDLCDGHGDCNEATRVCSCDPGYRGSACHELDCPGEPDCGGVSAECVVTDQLEGPRCVNCSKPYMGDRCEYR